MVEIREVKGFITYTSRGSPTIEVRMISTKGIEGRYASPSGASTGEKEVPMFPEGDVNKSVSILNKISSHLKGFKYESQRELDQYIEELDGTGRYENLGAALSLGLSMAGAELAANEMQVPLYYWLSNGHVHRIPLPLGNLLGGGKHARGRSIDIQEILVFPKNSKSYREAYEALVKTHSKVGMLLAKRDRCFTGGKNDEGAWTTSLSNEEALQLVSDALEAVESEIGIKLLLGVDVAASSLWDSELNKYFYSKKNVYFDQEDQINYILELVEKYNLKYVEDPVEENDYNGFSALTKIVGGRVYIVGDDIYVTNKTRISLGISRKSGNAIIIKPNQIGDLTKTLEAVEEARRGGFLIAVSHRSGETPYYHLSHVALAFDADLFKCGVMGGERTIKHSEIIRIESEYGGLTLASINK